MGILKRQSSELLVEILTQISQLSFVLHCISWVVGRDMMFFCVKMHHAFSDNPVFIGLMAI